MQPEENAEEQIPQPSPKAMASKAEPTSVETEIPHPPTSQSFAGQATLSPPPETVMDNVEPTLPEKTKVPEIESTQTQDPVPVQEISQPEPNIKVERHGTDVTITEVMPSPILEPAKPSQKTLWKSFLEKVDFRKRKRLERIMDLFNHKDTESHSNGRIVRHNIAILNDDVEKLLRVSDSTARRYLDSLEKEGKILQVGKAGKYTHYIKI